MSETSLTVRESNKVLDLETTLRHIVRVRRFNVDVLEMEDVQFHFDSAVLLPDFELKDTPGVSDADRITGIAVLRACLLHANSTKDQLLIAGHTDTSGPGPYNLTLSHQRSQNVFHALTGDRAAWVQSCVQKHQVEDYQQILKWVFHVWEWDTDPGAIDNKLGPKTKAATKEFQRSFNLDFSASLTEDGVVGPQTWGAFFDVYMEALKLTLETDDAGLAQLRQKLRFVDAGKKTVGCGENFPIEGPRQDHFRSRINRRVELLFFKPEELPKLPCHPSASACSPGACEIYKRHLFKFRHLEVPPITIKTLKRWVIRILANESGPPAKRKPIANAEFVVTGHGGPELKGKTDAKGVLRIPVHDDPCLMKLKVGGFEFQVEGGNLKKVHDDGDGVKRRLHNLGYGPHDVASWNEEDLKLSLKQFQKDHDLPDTGDADGATRARLRKEHGSQG